MPEQQTHTRPSGLAVWLVIAGVIGWWAAFSLTVEKIEKLANPDAIASCDLSVLVQCSANLDSWQGSVFGFPNPILGLTGWAAPIVVGMAILARARFARWFWWCFWAGIAFAFGFVIWLISQSIYAPNLHTLCPWCMVTWAVTIPTFYAVTLHMLRAGLVPASDRVRDVADRLMVWVPLAAIVSYAIILLLAQLEMNAVVNIWQTLFG
ncbi:vitamin K epoxide reductase family protein [Microbacterium trichothecenolyticum]|uniref:vitamin K epoxide reductase family protein n=1 Tax=Microbacterium trichothecenolyticum TaxID=69370 RepID=UPI0035BE1E82